MSSTTASAAPAARPRLLALDGLRGIAIVLVVLSHTWVLTQMPDEGPGRVLMTSGNYAVAYFFAIGGFLATRALLREVESRGQVRPAMFFVRRWIRISGQVYPLVLFVLVLTAIDTNMDTYKQSNTRASAWHILTYTWNGYLREQAFFARPDLGHLWYVCTDIWVVGMIAVAVFLLRGRRLPLFALFTVAAVLVYIFRRDVFVTESEAAALIRIHTRADGLLWGAAAAVAMPWLERVRPYGREIALGCFLALLPLMWGVNETGFFTIWSLVLAALLAMLVAMIALGEPPLLINGLLTNRALVRLGEYSFALYVWHYPVFWYISRNYPQWSDTQRVVVGYAVMGALALIVQRLIERPLVRWLSSDAWSVFADGLLPGLRTLATGRLRTATAARRARSQAAAPEPVDGDFIELDAEDLTAEVPPDGSGGQPNRPGR